MELDVGSKIKLEDEEYEIGEHIGSGGFAHVHEVVGGDRSLVVKEYREPLCNGFPEVLETSLRLRRSLAARCGDTAASISSDVLAFPRVDALVDGRKLVVMDRFSGMNSLAAFEEVLGEKGVVGVVSLLRKVVSKLFSILGGLIEHGMVHRDIKPENLLLENYGTDDLDDLVVRIVDIDFLASPGRARAEDNIFCSVLFVPPEVLKRDAFVSTTHDVFSLGFVVLEQLYFLDNAIFRYAHELQCGGRTNSLDVTHYRAFSSLTADPEAQRKLRAAVLEVEDVGTLRHDIHGLVEFAIAALQPNPADRPRTVEAMMQLLNSKPNI